MLSDSLHIPSADLADYVYLLYSEPGVGKTTFAAESGALILDFEAGYRGMEAHVLSFVDSNCPDPSNKPLRSLWEKSHVWQRFRLFLQWAEREGTGDFKSVAIDTVDVAYAACVDHICEKQGWSSPADGGQYGRGWAVVNEEFQKSVRRLMALGVGLGFTAHAQIRTVTPLGMQPHDKICPALPPSCSRWLVGLADFVLYAEAAVDISGEPVRVIHTQPSPRYQAKARGRKDIPLPSPLPLDFQRFQEAWAGCLSGRTVEPISIRQVSDDLAASGGNPWKQ